MRRHPSQFGEHFFGSNEFHRRRLENKKRQFVCRRAYWPAFLIAFLFSYLCVMMYWHWGSLSSNSVLASSKSNAANEVVGTVDTVGLNKNTNSSLHTVDNVHEAILEHFQPDDKGLPKSVTAEPDATLKTATAEPNANGTSIITTAEPNAKGASVTTTTEPNGEENKEKTNIRTEKKEEVNIVSESVLRETAVKSAQAAQILAEDMKDTKKSTENKMNDAKESVVQNLIDIKEPLVQEMDDATESIVQEMDYVKDFIIKDADVLRHTVLKGYDEIKSFLKNYDTQVHEGKLILFFVCSDDDGGVYNWSDLCAKATEAVNEAMAKADKSYQFVTIRSGSEAFWNKKNAFKTDFDLKLRAIPTLLQWNGNGRTSNVLWDQAAHTRVFLYHALNIADPDIQPDKAGQVVKSTNDYNAYRQFVEKYRDDPAEEATYPMYAFFISGLLPGNNRPWCPYCRFSQLPLDFSFRKYAAPNAHLIEAMVAPTYGGWKNFSNPFREQPEIRVYQVPCLFRVYRVQKEGKTTLRFERLHIRLDRLDELRPAFETT